MDYRPVEGVGDLKEGVEVFGRPSVGAVGVPQVAIEQSEVPDNSLARGHCGTIRFDRSTATLRECQICDNGSNHAYTFCVIYVVNSTVELCKSLLRGNGRDPASEYGGVRSHKGGHLRISNCTSLGNSEPMCAQGVRTDISNWLFLCERPIYFWQGVHLRVSNTTFYNQDVDGWAIRVWDEDASVDVANCIFSGHGYASAHVPLRFCCMDWERRPGRETF